MKKMRENKAASFRNADAFDRGFWKDAGTEARFSALWKMVEDFYRIRNRHGYKLRLQRSVERIKQA